MLADVPTFRTTTLDQDREIAALYADGERTGDIAERYGIAKQQVARIARRMGVEVRPHGPNRLPDGVEDEIVRRYVAGEPVLPLAREFGLHSTTIKTIARRHNVEQRPVGAPRRRFTREQVANMAGLWESGESQTAIAKVFNTTQIAVSRALRSDGIVSVPGRWNPPRAEDHSNWKGGRLLTSSGKCVMVHITPDDPLASMRMSQGYVLEHRLVMARALGRSLDPTETVHHINGDSTDNRMANLQLRQGRHGKGIVMRCCVCGSTEVESTVIAD